ncbi:uncharacterized protein TNCV_4022241 [Trichonephila clavipes]|nr:uncharacterized protein TNCV_4022241 [Trichonephila clavipes]
MIESNQEKESPISRPPFPITLKKVKNYREQLKKISENFPNITIKTAGEYIKLFPKSEEEKRNLTHFLELDKEYQFYVTQPKENKPLKVVLKANCFIKPRCLKCGKEHTTKECDINSRLENPFCINCQQYGHSACYTKCPKFPKPRKGAPTVNKTKNNFNSTKVVEGLSFANVLSGNTPIINSTQIEINPQESQSTSQSHITTETNANEAQNIMELFKIVVNIVKHTVSKTNSYSPSTQSK